MMSKILLYCGADYTYALTQEGSDGRETFDSMAKALDHARGLIKVETPLAIYGQTGRILVESTLKPKINTLRRPADLSIPTPGQWTQP